MPSLKYAQVSDWDGSDFTDGSAPTNAAKLIARASQTVESLTRSARYSVDDDGYPTDLAVSDVLRDATLAQASYWAETGDSTGAADSSGSMSIGSVSLGAQRSPVATGQSRQEARYAPVAVEILRNAGLISRTVRGW